MEMDGSESNRPTAAVVNDDPTQLTVLRQLLGKAGVAAICYETAEDALLGMQAAPPDLIVTDLYMPGIDGWRFCRLLRSPEYAAFNRVPILVVSATFAGDEASRIAADLGAQAFLPAPVDGKRFVQQVRGLLKGESLEEPARVLIVEDSRTLTALLKKSFEQWGYSTDTAGTVAEGLEKFEQGAYDVAVLDYHLPDGKGDTLLRAFQSGRPQCVCVMMTLDANPELALSWMKQGAAAYLRKPFEPEYLIELCRRVRRERALLRVEDLLEERSRELRESEEKYRILVDDMPALMCRFRPDGTLTFVNRAYCEYFGKTAEELIGKSFMRFIPEEDQAAVRKHLLSLDAENPYAAYEHQVVAADGRIRWQWWCDHALFDPHGNREYQSVGLDTTEQKEAQEAVKQRSRERRLLLDTIDAQVWYLTDIETYGAVNRAHADFLGLEIRDIAHKRLEEFLPKDVAEVCKASNVEVFDTRRPVTTEEWISNADGKERLVRICKTPKLDERGNVEYVVCAGTDITELRAAEIRFRTLFENAPVGIELYDESGSMILVNPACLKIFGVEKPEALMGFQLFDDPNVSAETKNRLRNGETVSYEVAFDFEKVHENNLYRTTKRGSVFLSVFITPLTAEHILAPGGYMVLVQDITDRKNMEEALRKERDFSQSIIETAQAILLVLDAEGRIVYFNPYTEELTGRRLSEVQGKNWFETFLKAGERKAVEALFDRAVDDVPTRGKVNAILAEDGRREIQVRWYDKTLKDQDGNPVGLLCIGHDVTQQLEMRALLADQKRRLDHILKGTHVGTWEWNVQTGETIFNERWAEIIGYTLAELSPVSIDTWMAYCHPEDLKKSERLLQACFDGESEFYECECRMRHKNGEWVWVLDRGKVATWTENGRPEWMYGTHQDITERIRLEEARLSLERRVQRMEKTESLSRMAGAVAHHFNNMLTAVIGNLELSRDGLSPNSEVAENLTKAWEGAQRAAEMSRLMLTFLGQNPGKSKPLDLADVCRKSLDQLEVELPEGVVLDAELPRPGPIVQFDGTQTEEVLKALITNAWEAMNSAPGEIRVTLNTVNAARIPDRRRFPLEWKAASDRYACLSIADTGHGMDSDVVNKVFDPFYSTKFTGRGLGLPVVLGIVKASGGCIAVESAPGKGSVFRVFLPISEKPLHGAARHSGRPGERL